MTAFNTRDKVMSITRREFDLSLAAFSPGAALDADGVVRLPAGAGHATIRFEPIDPLVIGNSMLRMPRAKVSLRFDEAVARDAEAQFIRSFEIAFQRGGG